LTLNHFRIFDFITIQYNTMQICIAPLFASESEALNVSVNRKMFNVAKIAWAIA